MDTASLLPAALAQSRERALDPMGLLSAVGHLTAAGNITGVIELYRTWLEHNPDNSVCFAMYFNLGALLSQYGDSEGARAALENAIRINPNFLPPYINLGNVLERLGRVGEGIQQWYKVAELLPQVGNENLNYKISALKQIGRVLEQYQVDENAESALRHSLDLNPNQPDVIQHWVSLRQRQCKWPVITPWGQITKENLMKGISALSLAAHTDDPLLQLANAVHYCKGQVGRPSRTYDANHSKLVQQAHPRRRKIGYLSSDLREHAIGFLTAELYEVHDRANVEVFLYYCGHKVTDSTHQRIKASAEHWIDLGGMSDEQAAERMVADGIEILVDINGYTHSARIKLIALRPAPIIVNWLGFPGTLGSTSHHYIIADDFIIPRESEIYYAEKVLKLPCYQPNDRKRVVADRTPTRAEAGLPEEGIIFCCFNGAHKITNFTWARWMSILKQVPNSVLWLLSSITATGERLKAHAAAAGIDPARIIFAPKARNPEHLARYPLADLFLDTSPYGAHTTSSDALWMGVPVLTLAGRSFASRVCGSLLKSAGLPELICSTPEQFVSMAVALGNNPQKLAAIRNKLKVQRDTCVLFDTPLLARHLEGLYSQMWDDFKAGQLPRIDTSNLDIYNEIGCELDDSEVELLAVPNYQSIYRQKLNAWNKFSYIRPDNRLWRGESVFIVDAEVAHPKVVPLRAPTESAKALFNSAKRELEKGNLQLGEEYLRRTLALDPKNSDALDMAARAALIGGRLDEAEGYARRAIQERPVVPIGLTLAEVMKAQGNLAGAAKFFLSVLETQPQEMRALVAMAEIYEQTGYRAKAISTFQKALALDPTNMVLASKYANLLPIDQLSQGLAALLKAKPPQDASLKARLAYLNQLSPYMEWTERTAHGLMPYHLTSLKELYFDFVRAQRDEYEAVADTILSQEPAHRDAIGAKAVCLISRGLRHESEQHFQVMAKIQPDSIYENIIFNDSFYQRLEAQNEAALFSQIPPLIDVASPQFSKKPIIYLSCNYSYYVDFARPLLLSINDVADRPQVHLHVMDASDAELEMVKSFCAGLKNSTIAISAERPGVAAKGVMPARCYYHAVRFIRLYQHLKIYQKPLWLMDVDALLHRDPQPMFDSIGTADVAFRARPGRWEPWNQFNASVVGFCPTERSFAYLRLIAAYVDELYRQGAMHWGIDQLAMYAVYEFLKDQGRPPDVHLLNDRAVDYEYYADGFVWCNSGKGKFSQLQHLSDGQSESPDLLKVSYFAALKTYMEKLESS